MDRKRLSALEAAKLLGLSRTTFQRRLAEWELKPVEPANPLLKRPKVVEFWEDEVLALKAHLSPQEASQ
jgi:hypothetical protein